MHLLLNFSEIPIWSWITAAVIVFLAIVAIVCIVLWAKKGSKKSKNKENGGAEDPKPVEKPVEKPAEKPVETRAKEPEPKPAAKPAETKAKETKPVQKTEPKSEPKPAAKPVAKPVAEKEEVSNSIPKADKVYHISKRKQDGKWQIKAAGGAKAIKLFDTQKEAIAYAKTLADNQDARIVVHKMDGSFKKDNY